MHLGRPVGVSSTGSVPCDAARGYAIPHVAPSLQGLSLSRLTNLEEAVLSTAIIRIVRPNLRGSRVFAGGSQGAAAGSLRPKRGLPDGYRSPAPNRGLLLDDRRAPGSHGGEGAVCAGRLPLSDVSERERESEHVQRRRCPARLGPDQDCAETTTGNHPALGGHPDFEYRRSCSPRREQVRQKIASVSSRVLWRRLLLHSHRSTKGHRDREAHGCAIM